MAGILKRLFALGYGTPMVSSAGDEASVRLEAMGYPRGQRVPTDAVYRTLFENIRADDAIDMICHGGGVRTVMLAKIA
jgi:hypothetical protein